MTAKSEKIRLAILKALEKFDQPAGASRLRDAMLTMGVDVKPRTVRHYLMQLDEEGLTEFISRRIGRQITDKGREELLHADVMNKLGFVASQIASLGYEMSLDAKTGEGNVVTNVAFVDRRDLSRSLIHMRPIFEAGLGMGDKVALAFEGESLGGFVVPGGTVAFATVCSVSINGIFLNQGIPVRSRFGGLVEMYNGEPVRFVDVIEYRGTSVDPLEVFIRANMTSVSKCAETGSGIVGASFREIPSVAVDDMRKVCKKMERQGVKGMLAVGIPNRRLLHIDVAEGMAGIVVLGGLNPMAALHEAGIPVQIMSLAGLEDFKTFLTFEEIAMKGRRVSPYID